jgi:hypothetical protein
MFKKLNLTSLLVVLALLLGVIYLSKEMGSKDRSFRSKLTDFESSKVAEIVYKAKDTTPVRLQHKSGGWIASQGEKSYDADSARVFSMLEQINRLKTKSVAATNREKWSDYEVTDSLATKVDVTGKDDKKLASLYVGKFSYKQANAQAGGQPQVTMTTYVRLDGDKEVYAVDGFLKMAFPSAVDEWRDKTIMDVEKQRIASVALTGKFNYSLRQEAREWRIDGQAADSSKVQGYLKTLSGFKAQKIAAHAFDKDPEVVCEVIADDGTRITVEAMKEQKQQEDGVSYLVRSTVNDAAVFRMKESTFERFFKEKTYFLK